MRKTKVVCKKCGYKFEVDVLEEGEAEEKRLSTRPIKCPKCGGSVEEI